MIIMPMELPPQGNRLPWLNARKIYFTQILFRQPFTFYKLITVFMRKSSWKSCLILLQCEPSTQTHPVKVFHARWRLGSVGSRGAHALDHGYYSVWHLEGIIALALPTGQLQRENLLRLSIMIDDKGKCTDHIGFSETLVKQTRQKLYIIFCEKQI